MKLLAFIGLSFFLAQSASAATVCKSTDTGTYTISHELVKMEGDKLGVYTKVVNSENNETSEDVTEVAVFDEKETTILIRSVLFADEDNRPSYVEINLLKKDGLASKGGAMLYASSDNGKTFQGRLAWSLACSEQN